jgi:hypothetical protein
MVIDDVVCSGVSLSSMIQKLSEFNLDKRIHFHFVIPYVTKKGEAQIRSVARSRHLLVVRFYFTRRLLSLPVPPANVETLTTRFSLHSREVISVYFDHKVVKSAPGSIYVQGVLPGRGTNYGSVLPYLPDTSVKMKLHPYFHGLLPEPVEK